MTKLYLLFVLFTGLSLLVVDVDSFPGEDEPLELKRNFFEGNKRLLPFVPSPDDFELEESPAVAAGKTTLENYPSPLTHPAACNRQHLATSYVCDPDRIMHRQDADHIEEMLAQLRLTASHTCGSLGKQPYMLGVAVIRKLPLGVSIDVFATELLDRWGLGHSECHDGMILVYSKEDNVSAVKWKKGVEPSLNHVLYAKLHKLIKLDFEQKPVGKAMEQAVDRISYFASGKILAPRQTMQLVVMLTIATLVAIMYLACIVVIVGQDNEDELDFSPRSFEMQVQKEKDYLKKTVADKYKQHELEGDEQTATKKSDKQIQELQRKQLDEYNERLRFYEVMKGSEISKQPLTDAFDYFDINDVEEKIYEVADDSAEKSFDEYEVKQILRVIQNEAYWTESTSFSKKNGPKHSRFM